jgi:N-acetylneuraminic acid mutarotase
LAAALFVWWWVFSAAGFPLLDPATTDAGRFTLSKQIPIARTEAGSAVLDEKLYVLGGIGPLAQSFASFQVYDPAADRWEALPDPPEEINHPALIGHEGKIYVVGGFGPIGIRLRGFMFARWDPKDTLHVYDVETRVWAKGPRLPEARGAGAATLADDAIWYAGGIAPDLEVNAALFRYDLKEQTWMTRADMTVARDHLRLEALGNELFAISGRKDDLRHNLPIVERYRIATNTWEKAADIPLARGGLASVVFRNYIYTFGGELTWRCIDQIERYDPRRDRWEVLGRLPEARHGIQAGVLGERIHLVSGGKRPRISVSPIHRVYEPRP